MIKFLLLSLLCLSSLASADTKLSVYGSLLYNSPDIKDQTGVENNSELGYGAGLRALMGISDQLYLRSGAGLVQRNVSQTYKILGTTGDADLSFVYLNIPLTLYWKASSQVGFFGGTALNAKLSDKCHSSGNLPSCSVPDAKSLVLPAIIGFDFSFSEKIGMELSYEHGLTEVAKDIKINSAVVSFLYHLD